MMNMPSPSALMTLLTFLALITPLVFVHEWGHYIVARLCGIRIEVFSIGFGPEIIGWTDRNGTRWKISLLPLGGYVRFFGDASGASDADHGKLEAMTAEDQAVCFHFKPVWQRAAVVAAGPVVNILFAILLFAGVFVAAGQPFSPPVVTGIQAGSRAESAGIRLNDRIVAIDGKQVESWEEIFDFTVISPEKPLHLTILRDGGTVTLTATPKSAAVTDRFGKSFKRGLLGISHRGYEFRRVNPLEALDAAGQQALQQTRFMLITIGQVITGAQTLDAMGGPVKMARLSGEVALAGFTAFVMFGAGISLSLGIANLFPIPMLDGGHLLFCLMEALRGRPLSRRLQELAQAGGFILVVSLLVLLTWNDLS